MALMVRCSAKKTKNKCVTITIIIVTITTWTDDKKDGLSCLVSDTSVVPGVSHLGAAKNQHRPDKYNMLSTKTCPCPAMYNSKTNSDSEFRKYKSMDSHYFEYAIVTLKLLVAVQSQDLALVFLLPSLAEILKGTFYMG